MEFIDPRGSFLKNLVLSVLLLGLGSLVIPVLLKQIDDRKFADQQRFQAELSRQDKIIDAQAALLDTLAADFWNYELYASDVLYSHDARYGQDDWHQRAVDAYYVQSGPLLGAMRADISKLLRLAPGASYDDFLALYEGEILPLDSCILELLKKRLSLRVLPLRVLPLETRSRHSAWQPREDSPRHRGTRLRTTLSSRPWPNTSIRSWRRWPGR